MAGDFAIAKTIAVRVLRAHPANPAAQDVEALHEVDHADLADDDADALRHAPAIRLAARSSAGLWAGAVGTADEALDMTLDAGDRARKTFCDVAMVGVDVRFPSAALLAGLDARRIDYASR